MHFYKSVSVVVSDVGFLGRVSIIRSSWESSVRRACVCASPAIRIAVTALWAARGRGRYHGFSSSDRSLCVSIKGQWEANRVLTFVEGPSLGIERALYINQAHFSMEQLCGFFRNVNIKYWGKRIVWFFPNYK